MNKHKYTFNLFERYAKMIKKARILGGVCMKTEWLEWLVLFKKYKSLQKVSDVCHVTPQNIGKMFNHLEDELGVQLFEKKGKTKYWLYIQLGLSYQNFNRIVNNETKSIKFENLKAICDILECTPNDLFEEYYLN